MIERFAGRYALLRRLGRGGMGEVYLARDLDRRVECALKHLSARSPGSPEQLRREFEVLSHVRHPCVVEVYELDFTPDGAPFFTMEFVPGVPADQALARGDHAALAFVAAQVTHGLEALHGLGIVHGDLKPSNLLVIPASDPRALPLGVRLLDFGLAVLLGRGEGGYRGTPGYAAPEVVEGRPAEVGSDLYGLGALLYATASGQPPFPGSSREEIRSAQAAGPPPATPLEERGVAPGLIRLILRLMASDPRERPRDAREVRRELESLHPAARRPLTERLQAATVVGREREVARFESRLASADGPGRVMLVAGSAGSGKTALLGHLAARAALAGRRVVHLSCAGFGEPGALALTVLRRWAAAGSDASLAGLAAPARALVASEARTFGPEMVDALVAAAVQLGRNATGRLPVVLLDDAERLDPLSWSVVVRLALHPTPPSSEWVLARRGEASLEERSLVAAGAVDLVGLEPLTRDQVDRLVAARLGQPTPAPLLDFLVDRAGGHPGFTVQLLLAAAAAGALRDGDAEMVVDPDALEHLDLPGFEASLLARHRALPAPSRGLVAALAVWGRPMTLESALELARASGSGPDAGALEPLLADGLVMRDADGRLALLPPALDAPLRRGLDPATRRALHRAALALPGLTEAERFRHLRDADEPQAALAAAERSLATHPDPALAAKAAALAESRQPTDAAPWHERHARLLMAAGRYAAAAPPLERALALEPESPERHARRLGLCTAYLRTGGHARLGRLLAEALADHPPPALKAQLLADEAARLGELAGSWESARGAAEAAMAEAESSGDQRAVAVATMTLAGVRGRIGLHDAAESSARRALRAFTEVGDQTGIVRALASLGWLANARQDQEACSRLLAEAVATARGHGLRLALEEALGTRAALLTEIGRWDDARADLSEQARLALEDGRARGAAQTLANLALLEGLVGAARAARRRALAARRLAAVALPGTEATALRALAQAHRLAGRLSRAEAVARLAIRLALERSMTTDLEWSRIELARVWMARGRWPSVRDLVPLPPAEAAGPASVGTRILMALAARAALRTGDLEMARAWLTRAENGPPAPIATAMLDVLRVELAIASGRIAEAREMAQAPLALLASLPAPADRASAIVEIAQLAVERGHGDALPLGSWLDEAAATFERLGNTRARERALVLQVQWLRRAAIAAARPASDRELIASVSGLLDSMSDLATLTDRAMDLIVHRLDAERGVLVLAAPRSEGATGDDDDFVAIAEKGSVDAGTRREALGYSRRAVRRVTSSGVGFVTEDAPSDPSALSESVVDLRLRSIMCVPMFAAGRVIGAVYVDDSRRTSAFSESDRRLLEGFAQLMALAIERSRGHEEVVRENRQLVDENLSLRSTVISRFQGDAGVVVGCSVGMQRVMAQVESAAKTDSTVLLTGENGTGKELIAHMLHRLGKRRKAPFVVVNCGAIPESLLESELFGIRSYVATGVRARDGRFLQANGGTLFLDEVGEMPLRQQVALLAVLANHQITPIGGSKSIPVDVRVIAATNRDLREQVKAGAFREDLYYRLCVIPIEVPPLRERKADIPDLARRFLKDFAASQQRPEPTMSPSFMAALMQSDWPGNVRELQNYIERMVAMTQGDELEPTPPPRDLEERANALRASAGGDLLALVEDLERRLVSDALHRARGNQSLAARELGMTEQSIRYRIRKYNLRDRQDSRTRRKQRAFRN